MRHQIALETLAAEEYSIVKSFFKDLKFYKSFLDCILEQRCEGTVVVDHRHNPTFALVFCPPRPANLYAPVYFAGEFDPIIIPFLKAFSKISLITSLDWEHRSLFEEAGFKPLERMQLRRANPVFELASWNPFFPTQYSISPINEKNFAQCTWYPFISACYATEECFFRNGIGFCLIDQGKIVTESYAIIAGETAEIGIVTDSAYRGQNLGTLICAMTLDYCYKNNIAPIWNCDVHNVASAAIAKKLGFEVDSHYCYLNWIAPEGSEI